MGKPTPRNTVREREVLKLRKRGLTYDLIGKKLDITRQRVYAIIKRATDEGRFLV